MGKMIFKVRIEKGKYDLSELDSFLRNKDGNYLIEVKKQSAKRSLPQNSLYHKWVGLIADDLGYFNPEEVCRALKIKLGLCHTETDKITKGKKWICPTTAGFNKVEMSEFMDRVDKFALVELNINLPRPEEVEI